LEKFDAYLDDKPSGTLAEEALVGRAQALAKLGRAQAEARAWQRLIERFPGSAHAPAARRRIDALGR
jgi:TolA-binding protein